MDKERNVKRKVTKRNGSEVLFDWSKIEKAVSSAFAACDVKFDAKILDLIKAELSTTYKVKGDKISVETIQDTIEDILMKSDYPQVAKAYILYREKHKELRLIKNRVDWIDNYMNSTENAASSSETDANANVTIKNVANIDGEVYKALNRQIQRYRMTKKLEEMYPEVASQYVKDLEHHIIYAHDEASSPSIKNYCEAVSLYPLLLEGTKNMDGLNTTPPKNLSSFCGQLVNLIFLLSAQCKGAVAIGELFNFLDYFCAKDFGENYHQTADRLEASVRPQRTIRQVIHQAYQQLVYSINQPAGNRSWQSPFTNISYYDSNYWHALFDDFCFPDGTKPVWERVDWLQRDFIHWFNEERTKTLLTFPVESMCLLSDSCDVIDKSYKELTSEMYSEGHSFFTYISDNPNALASCCFSKDTKIVWKSSSEGVRCTTLEELHNMKWKSHKENLKILHNGSWVSGKSIKLPNRNMYKVTTYNNKEFIMSDNHINVTYNDEKPASSLTTDDYLMFNTSILSAVPERDEHLTYNQGLLVGLFIGDGTFGNYVCQDGSVHTFQLSLNKDKWEKVEDRLATLGQFNLGTIYNNVYPINCCSKELTTFISRWTTNEPNNTNASNKSLNLDCLLQSEDFRKGILDGWYITDGGNSNRCYTISKSLVENMEILCTSLGLQTIINISDRTDEDVIIRGEKYSRNYPLYCLRWYSNSSHRVDKDRNSSWKKKNNSIYWRIKSIEPVNYTEDIYCIECSNQDEPYFTLPSGLITHNCRLRNEIAENVFSFTNGLSGVQTGSANVITLNLNRIVQDYCRETLAEKQPFTSSETMYKGLSEYLTNILERVYKYHIAYKTLLYEVEEKGMLNASTAGYIKMSNLFSTIGINGLNEAAEFMGITCNYNLQYKQFCNVITSTISRQNKLHSNSKFKFNTELVPAETLSSKNYKWDSEDGYWVNPNRNLYNSYFYLAEDPNTSVLERFKLHGKEFTETLDGGVGLHCNLEDHLSKEQYLELIKFAAENGTSYFTFNIPNTQCDDCGAIFKKPLTVCPKCGSTHMTQWTRIIGYLRPIKAFDSERQKEAARRYYTKVEKC